MASGYFNLPSFTRAEKHKEELEQTKPTDPVLKDEDARFLEEHIADEQTKPVIDNNTATKIADNGEETAATAEEKQQMTEASDQAVIPDVSFNNKPEKSYDDIMKEKAAERVQIRKAKKQKSLELPSQEEAEAATKGFNAQAEQAMTSSPTSNSKRTWASYLPASVRPNSRDKNQEEQQSNEDESNSRTWQDYATSYLSNIPVPVLPALPASLNFAGKNKNQSPARPPSPVYNEDGTVNEEQTRQKNEREITVLLDQLSLSQINNRVFSFSAETQGIYERFALILKDTINGAPTAYDDMETLMKEAGPKLQKQFEAMPPFVRTLVKSLPAKMGASLGPEVLAAMGEKPGVELTAAEMEGGSRPSTADSGISVPEGKAESREKKKRRIPGLKSLLSKEGAVATLLRNVVNFLQTRFPFLASGTNVVMSLAVFSKLTT